MSNEPLDPALEAKLRELEGRMTAGGFDLPSWARNGLRNAARLGLAAGAARIAELEAIVLRHRELMARATRSGLSEGEARERARIVAYLRTKLHSVRIENAADEIESSAHAEPAAGEVES